MMNDQEMQFADPEWRPRQGQGNSYAEAESYNPRPINDDRPRSEQPQWEEVPEHVYKAQDLPPYQAPPVMGSPYQYQQVKPRRRSSPWVWLIAMLIVLSLLGGMMSRFGGSSSSGFAPMQHGFPAYHVPFAQGQSYKVDPQSTPTIFINNTGGDGDIQVQEGGDQPVVTVQSDGPKPAINQTSPSALNVNVIDSEDVTVTVPNNTNLIITTGDGDVTVDNVVGQMTLTSGNGDITLHGATLTRNSTIKSSDGDITFDGQLDPSGSYQFNSSGGAINLSLPSNSAFSLNATATNGSIDTSGFSQVQVQQTGSGATAHGDVGSEPRATLTVTTDSGDISFNAQ